MGDITCLKPELGKRTQCQILLHRPVDVGDGTHGHIVFALVVVAFDLVHVGYQRRYHRIFPCAETVIFKAFDKRLYSLLPPAKLDKPRPILGFIYKAVGGGHRQHRIAIGRNLGLISLHILAPLGILDHVLVGGAAYLVIVVLYVIGQCARVYRLQYLQSLGEYAGLGHQVGFLDKRHGKPIVIASLPSLAYIGIDVMQGRVAHKRLILKEQLPVKFEFPPWVVGRDKQPA